MTDLEIAKIGWTAQKDYYDQRKSTPIKDWDRLSRQDQFGFAYNVIRDIRWIIENNGTVSDYLELTRESSEYYDNEAQQSLLAIFESVHKLIIAPTCSEQQKDEKHTCLRVRAGYQKKWCWIFGDGRVLNIGPSVILEHMSELQAEEFRVKHKMSWKQHIDATEKEVEE